MTLLRDGSFNIKGSSKDNFDGSIDKSINLGILEFFNRAAELRAE